MPESLAELEADVRKDPKMRRFFDLAKAYQKEGRLDEAADVCQRGLEHNPTKWQARILLVQLLLAEGKMDEARSMVERVLLALPDNVPANHLAADIYYNMGNMEGALKHYRIVLLFDPDNAPAAERIEELTSEEEEPSQQDKESPPVNIPPVSAEGVKAEAEGTQPSPSPGEEVFPESEDGKSGGEESASLPEESPGPSGGEVVEDLVVPAGDGPVGSAPADEEEVWSAPGGNEEETLLASTEDAETVFLPVQGGEENTEEIPTVVIPVAPTGVEEGVGRDAKPGAEPPGEPVLPLPGKDSLDTITLAELYEKQGYPDKAVEVYQRILLVEPNNTAVHDKIRALVAGLTGEGQEPGAPREEDQASALRNKRIKALQGWLRVVKEA